MRVIIRNPQKIFYEGFAKEAILQGEDGEFSIWDFHQSLISSLRKSSIILRFGKELKPEAIEINGGLATFDRNELMVLCL